MIPSSIVSSSALVMVTNRCQDFTLFPKLRFVEAGWNDVGLLKGSIALFADDCKTSRVIDDASDRVCFQRDLDNLLQWSTRNAMAFNVKKCKVMRLSKKRQPLVSNYFLDDSLLEEVKGFKDLGVTTTDNFYWNSHIDLIVSKANRMLGLVKRTCRGLDNTKTLRTLYYALARSNVEYCSVVWSPFTKKNIEKVEKVQRRATKFILKTQDNYETRLKKLNLMSLKKRRFLADVTFLYKALNGISNIKSLVEYCKSRGALPGPLFCQQNLTPITVYQFNTELSRCLQFCGLDTSRYKGHSFRIGAASLAADKGFSDAQIRTLGRWKSDAFKLYIRSECLQAN